MNNKLKWEDCLTKELSWDDVYKCISLYNKFTEQKSAKGRKTGQGSIYWKAFVSPEIVKQMDDVLWKNFSDWAAKNNIELPERIEGLSQYEGGYIFEEAEEK